VSSSPSPSATPTPSPASGEGRGSPTPTTASPRPSRGAADELEPFFAQARLADGRLRAAAALVNADLGARSSVRFREATVAAARAAKPTAAARAIPGGLPPRLLGAVLLVYSDLADRSAALNQVGFESDGASLLECLRNGRGPAARFAADLAAAQKLAAASGAFDPAPPGSRTVAEVALQVWYVDGFYNGCGGCGGQLLTRPQTIVWKAEPAVAPGSPPTDGTIGGVRFWARYQAGRGWDVGLMAC
jgi:hypothetical protein